MKQRIVPAGEYSLADNREKTTIAALLLSCVGVAIYDRVTGVGGLCHILLPDPPGNEKPWQPKCYASSSLALFVDDLLRRGADRDRLEAVVAGGALGLPFSRHDMDLDIGGRTADCVNLFLKRHNIPVVSSETGGCSGMKMCLHVPAWEVEVTQLVMGDHESTEIKKPSRKEIRQAVIMAKPIPQIALKIIRLLQTGNYELATISRELRRDQVLSARVISFCNSAYIGLPGKIDSIERATLILGESRLLQLVISESLKVFFMKQEGGYSLIRGGLYKHALTVGLLTRAIAMAHPLLDEKTAYTAGLLHDIGKIVLDQYVAETRPMFYNLQAHPGQDMTAREKEVFGIDHQEIGRELAEIWNLPDNLRETVSTHHQPEKAGTSPELVHAVSLADLLASWFLTGMELEQIAPANLAHTLKCLHISGDDIQEIMGRVAWAELMYF